MNRDNYSTVPIRCDSCGQQTHKTLDAIVQNGGLLCDCGAFTKLDVEAFTREVRKAEGNIKDFGRHS